MAVSTTTTTGLQRVVEVYHAGFTVNLLWPLVAGALVVLLIVYLRRRRGLSQAP